MYGLHTIYDYDPNIEPEQKVKTKVRSRVERKTGVSQMVVFPQT